MEVRGEKMTSCYTKEDLEVLLDNIPYSAWIKDKNNKYVYVNEEYAHILGEIKGNIIGKQDRDLWSIDQCIKYRASDEEVIKTRMPNMFEEVKEKIHIQDGLKLIKQLYLMRIMNINMCLVPLGKLPFLKA